MKEAVINQRTKKASSVIYAANTRRYLEQKRAQNQLIPETERRRDETGSKIKRSGSFLSTTIIVSSYFCILIIRHSM